ncbi:MAG: hypothetical protein O3A01_01310 [bacterium]|nr:hypothetical protein [bacterium]
MKQTTFSERLLYSLLDRDGGSINLLKIATKIFPKSPLNSDTLLQSQYSREVMQGMLNSQFIPNKLDSIWPYWVYRQAQPDSPSFTISAAPPMLMNSTNRNWTGLSSPKITPTPIVDPKGLITPYSNGWSIDLWIANSKRIVSPAILKNVTQTFNNAQPSILTEFELNELEISSEAMVSQRLAEEPILLNKVTAKNNSDKTLKFSLIFAIRPYNPLGVSPIEEITFLTSNTFIVNNQIGLQLDTAPDNVICLNHNDGDITQNYGKWEMIFNAKCPKSMATAYAEYRLTLKPGESQSLVTRSPIAAKSKLLRLFQSTLEPNQKKALSKRIERLSQHSYEEEMASNATQWKSTLESLSSIEVPDEQLNSQYKNSVIHTLSMCDETGLISGPFTDRNHSTKINCYGCFTLNRIGAHEQSAKILTHMARQLNSLKILPNGQNKVEDMALFCLAVADYFAFTQDYSHLEKWFPIIEGAIKSIEKSPLKYHIDKHPIASLFSTPISSQPKHIDQESVTNVMWAIAASHAGSKLSKALQKDDRHLKYEKLVDHLTRYFDTLTGTISEQDCPLDDQLLAINPGMIPALIGAYPLELFTGNNPLLRKILHHIEAQHTVDGIYFSHFGHSGLGATYNCQLAQTYLMSQNQKLHRCLDWLKSVASETGCWPETLNPISTGGMVGDGHYIWASIEYIKLIRNCMVWENKNTLVLLAGINPNWVKTGKTIRLTKGNTRFGPISFELNINEMNAVLTLTHQLHTKPKTITMQFPYKIQSIQIGQTTKQIDGFSADIPFEAESIFIQFTNETRVENDPIANHPQN